MANAADTLFLPHKAGMLPPLQGSWLYLGGTLPDNGMPNELKDFLVCEQPQRGAFLQLMQVGVKVEADIECKDTFDGAFILINKHRGENEAMIAKASKLCGTGKPILIAGDKNNGIASLRKRVSQLTDIIDAMAKHHATVFWLGNCEALQSLALNHAMASPSGFQTAPGMFSHQKIDVGSALLAEHIDSSIRGAVSDFGAGWGYLSQQVLERSKPDFLDLYEAHWPSLKAAEHNLCEAQSASINYYWHDLTAEPVTRKYDAIVMNPPFHKGRKTEASLGEKFIQVAAFALKPKGKLLMVANTNLAYERALSASFTKVEQLERRDGFKVIAARK